MSGCKIPSLSVADINDSTTPWGAGIGNPLLMISLRTPTVELIGYHLC